MPEFKYKARNRGGRIVSSTISSANPKTAREDLYNLGFKPLTIKQIGGSGPATKGINRYFYKDEKGRLQIRLGPELPSTKELAVFTKQFSLMIENGVPLLQCLHLLAAQQKKHDFKNIISTIHSAVEKGANLSNAMEPHKSVFYALYVSLVRAGEASGHLDIILRQLVVYIEKAAKIKSQIKSAMTYPTIIVLVAIGVITLLLTFVVPTFAKQFSDNRQELPEVTQFVVTISDLLINEWFTILIGLTGIISFFVYGIRTEKGRRIFDDYILKAPIFGDVLLKIAISRFCSTMSTMLSSGVSILEALTICAKSSGNKTVEDFVMTLREQISKGSNFADPLTVSPLFPPMVSSMVAVGETTGTLDETLGKIAEIYDDEVDAAIETMTAMLEPLMIVIIGSIVGFIVIAMYLPIFDLAGTVG